MLVPCALGGLLDDATVARLRCRVIAGAANNQLAEDRIAELLATRGILWAPDFVANAGGLINIAEELGGYDPAVARRRVAGDRRHAAGDLRPRRAPTESPRWPRRWTLADAAWPATPVSACGSRQR